MDKMKMQANPMDKILSKVMEICPAAVQNGKIDFERLREELADAVESDKKESYDFTWVGKRAAIVEANTPIRKTLRPAKKESKNWDTTENLYIEGDNLEVLKLLQESYLGKVKMIYIDPPYNTGKDFVYRDNFKKNKADYELELGMDDEESGERLFKNTETNGRFHSDWCSMIYPRLKLARDFLTDDGVIFISIDDNEVANLRKICDEVFGEDNFVAQITLATGASQNGDGVKIQKNVEYCLVFAKSQEQYIPIRVDEADDGLRNLNDAPTALSTRPDMGYTIYYNPLTKDMIPIIDYDKDKIHTNDENLVYSNREDLIKKGYYTIRPGIKNNQLHRWRWGIDTFSERKKEIIIQKRGNEYIPYFKQSGYLPPKNLLSYSVGTSEVKELFSNYKIFDFPKSVKYLKYLISFNTIDNDIILDFFSGSATTAHAIMQLNAEDGGNRKFILVQLPEKTAEDSEAYKAGYKNICEIGKERIRRAGEKIKAEHATTAPDLDVGFRVLKLDDTNMKDVYYAPSELKQSDLIDSVDNIRDGRTPLDLLFGVMIDWGLQTLTSPIAEKKVGKNTIYIVGDNDLAACFDAYVPENVIREMAALHATRAVFRDSSFARDDAKINAFELFKSLAPDTEVKVI